MPITTGHVSSIPSIMWCTRYNFVWSGFAVVFAGYSDFIIQCNWHSTIQTNKIVEGSDTKKISTTSIKFKTKWFFIKLFSSTERFPIVKMQWMSDYFPTPHQQFVSYIMSRSRCVLLRWRCFPLYVWRIHCIAVA